MNRLLYAVHKWISAAAFVQLAIWTVTGFLFAWISQERLKSAPVDGAHHAVVAEAPPVAIARALEVASPSTGPVDSVLLRATPSGLYYVVKGAKGTVRIDARFGQASAVGQTEAEAIARRDQPGAPAVKETTLIQASPPIEYRECEHAECALPVFRVLLADDAGTAIYVDATTGDVMARRNDIWRTYDFLWSLHIMDYRGREDFNHLLIRCAAILAVATVLSGIVLLCVKATRWMRLRIAGRLPRN
jgi:uncharacterized iron-regulated membrane protein